MQDPICCTKCNSENIYKDGNMWTCPECGNEWTPAADIAKNDDTPIDDGIIKDAHGNPLTDGDAITVIKELRIKGSSSVVKVGTKVKSIRLVESNDGHNIACKIDGLGAINLKSEFVKKA